MTDSSLVDLKSILEAHVPMPPYDQEMHNVLVRMLEDGTKITVRAVVRAHPKLKHASAVTRNPNREIVVMKAQQIQDLLGTSKEQNEHLSKSEQASKLVKKELEIQSLKRKVELLTYTVLGMYRAVGARGGYAELMRFYKDFAAVQKELADMGAIPTATVDDIRKKKRE